MASSPLLRLSLALGTLLVSSGASVLADRSGDHHHHSLATRANGIPDILPGSWTSKGCYTDNSGGRALTGPQYTSGNNMTVENCINFCSTQTKPYIYAGLEYASECFCGNAFAGTNTNTTLSSCNMACNGNKAQNCGAGDRLSVYWSGVLPPAPPSTVPKVGNWTSLGCYNDDPAARTLPINMGASADRTIETCTSTCFKAGYPYAGAEYSTECFCGSKVNTTFVKPLADCSMTCGGNSSQFCGGPGRLNMYNYTGTDLPAQAPTNPGGGGNNPPPPTGKPVFSVTSDLLPTGWAYNSCYVDNANGRILTYKASDNSNQTIQSCINTCSNLKYTLAGAQYGVECHCGNSLNNGAALAVNACTTGCPGNSTQACGAGARVSLYTSTPSFPIYAVPKIQKTGLPTKWNYTGCYTESSPVGNLPYKIVSTTNNTVATCLSQCEAYGYPVAGLEYGQECWCGDQTHIDKGTGSFGADAGCNQACSGDPTTTCGAGGKLAVYNYAGGIDTFGTPAVTGWYENFIGGKVIPLIVTVGINNKVTFLEKAGTSPFPNTTGAYELDLSLIHDFSKAYREMHVRTDVFCGASIVLPDRAGRQINIGGWSEISTKGVRLYTPSGSAGVNGTTDWEENYNSLHLQRQRWYPSAVVLTNGSVLVVGGQIGSNGDPEPTLEILPQPVGGSTYLYMDWLDRTDPNNLYPFLFVLPSGNVFVGYYNEARILDPATFDTLVSLPNMPGNVNNPLAGRTYPMEGAAVMLPQHAPYNDPVELLVCGGSTPVEGTALDSCVSIAPEVPNAQWVYERMPSKRVMPCMAALPDGTFLIVNGAQQGHAGFDLASRPNLNAIIYNPSLPRHSRFSILNNTIVARLYHSEATLLPDGRVLITGSDPNPDKPFNGPFPEEFRVEVYVPPYLAAGQKQPTFSVPVKDWAYGGQYTLEDVQLFMGGNPRVSLIAATSSTHGAIMGGRTLFPDVSCSGTTCTVTAPPNIGICPPGWFMVFVLDGATPSHAQWVRIGGDPGNLGNWPALPGFTVPGVGGLLN